METKGEQTILDIDDLTVAEEGSNPPANPQDGGGSGLPAEQGGGGTPAPSTEDPTGKEVPVQPQQGGDQNNQQPAQQGKGEGDQGDEGDKPIVEVVKEQLGLEGIKDKPYEDTEVGISNLVRDAAGELASKEFQRIISSNDLLKEVIEHYNNGGNPQDLLYAKYPRRDYRTMEFDDSDTDFHKQVITDYYKQLGESDNDIQETVKDYENAGTLSKHAQKSFEKLKNFQNEYERQLKEEQKKKAQDQQQNIRDFWNKVWSDMEKRGDVGGIKLPEAYKSEFFEYVSAIKDTASNKSQSELDLEKGGYEQQLFEDYLRFLHNKKGLSLSHLINSKAETKKSESLRNRINGEKEKGKGKGSSDDKNQPSGFDNISMQNTIQST